MTRTGLVLDDRYKLDEPIAAGGVGQVWRAVDLLLDRRVAVKLLRPEYANHPETLERFRSEARHAGSLTHPCIARVYDYGNGGPAAPPYLVMEYVNGPSLADMLAVDPMDPVLALDVVAQAAAGLDAAHRSGLVHRDIKPGNILVGEDGLVKVTDFGIAHAAGSAPITGPGLVMGTTQYMAPERIAGAPATPASDLYSLGILIHECLTGLPPYDGGTAEVMAGHLYLPLPPLPSRVPPELDELVARLTAKDPEARLSDAAELANLARQMRDMLAADPDHADASHADVNQADVNQAGAIAPPAMGTGQAAAAVPVPLAGAAALDAGAGENAGAGPGGSGPARTTQPRHPRRRRSAALAAAATVLAGAGVAWLLVAAAPSDSPAADHAPVSPPATSAPHRSAPTAPPTTPARTRPAHSDRTARPRTSPTRAAHSSRTGASGSRSTTAATSAGSSGSNSGSAPASTQPAANSPAPAPTPTPTCQLGLLGICLAG